MIQILALNGTIPLHKYTDGYKIAVTPVESENKFRAASGNEIVPIIGQKTVINCSLAKVPHAVSESINEIVTAGSFDLTYTSPISITNKFRCTKYDAEPKSSDPRQKNPLITENITWNISMTFESLENGGTSADGL